MRKVILASSSERRAEILRNAGIPFDIQPSDYHEDMSLKLSAKKLAETLALGKALAVAPLHDDAIIIAADTFVVLGKKFLGKPGSAPKAIEMLKQLSGKKHEIVTGYAIIDTKSGSRKVSSDTAKVWFRRLTPREIESYVKNGKPRPTELAGGYGVQTGGARFVKRIEGDYSTILGLPIAKIVEELAHFGILP